MGKAGIQFLIHQVARNFSKCWPNQDPQIGIAIGKYYWVTTLEDALIFVGDITKIRYSKRHGFRGRLKDGRRVRLW